MATVTDLQTGLLAQWSAVLAVSLIDNMQETTNKGFKNYELCVNNSKGGKDAIGIRDNFIVGDPKRYTIYMRTASQQLTREKGIIPESLITSGVFATQEGIFMTKLEGLRNQVYQHSIEMVSGIGIDMVARLS